MAAYDAHVLVGDHYRDAATALGDSIEGIPDRTVLCAIVCAPADDQQLMRIPRLLQWPGVPGMVKISVQPSKVVAVGSHTAPPAQCYITDTLEASTHGIYRVPEQRPFPGSSLLSRPAAAPQPQPDVIEMAAAIGAAEAAAADVAAEAAVQAAGVMAATSRRRHQRSMLETMQRRMMRAFVKPQMADMLLALSKQRRSDQEQISARQQQVQQLQQQVQQLQQQVQQLQQQASEKERCSQPPTPVEAA